MYTTSQIAKLINVHPNTIRFYEEMKLLPTVNRKENGYRIFTDEHLEQLKLLKIALRNEIVQGDLRNMAIQIIRISAVGDIDKALQETYSYKQNIQKYKANAEEVVDLIEKILNGYYMKTESNNTLKRNEVAKLIGVSIDVIRNWERNGLIEIPRKVNGYREYSEKEIDMLKIIHSLRKAHYSMMSILRMINKLKQGSKEKLKYIINTPEPEEDIVGATDKLITSLTQAEYDANEMIIQLYSMKPKKL